MVLAFQQMDESESVLLREMGNEAKGLRPVRRFHQVGEKNNSAGFSLRRERHQQAAVVRLLLDRRQASLAEKLEQFRRVGGP